MNDPSQPHLFLNDAPLAIPLPGFAEQLTAWLVGVAATGIAILVVVFAVATQSGADAERIAGSRDSGVSALVSAIAASHGRPGAI